MKFISINAVDNLSDLYSEIENNGEGILIEEGRKLQHCFCLTLPGKHHLKLYVGRFELASSEQSKQPLSKTKQKKDEKTRRSLFS